MGQGVLEKMEAAGILLPPPPKPAGNYSPAVLSGNLLYLSGQGPRLADGSLKTGVVGRDVSTQEAYEHARLCGLNLLAVAQQALGSLDRVKRVVKVLGFVQATPDFKEHPKVINGATDLFVEVFGDEGRPARSAVGMGSLPSSITTEVEAIFEVEV